MIIFFQMIPKRKKFGNFRFAWKKEKTISLLEMDLCANWQQIPEIPPRPPDKGGLGGFLEGAAIPPHSLFGSGSAGLCFYSDSEKGAG